MCINSFSGHYELTLSSHLDRGTAMRLAEISAHENAWCRRSNHQWQVPGHGHTSQKQNKNNFRNELYGRVPMEHGISDDFFRKGLQDKTMGNLEFDFVSTTRPMEGFTAPTYEDEDLSSLFTQKGFYSVPDGMQATMTKLAPEFLQDAVITYRVEDKLFQKRSAHALDHLGSISDFQKNVIKFNKQSASNQISEADDDDDFFAPSAPDPYTPSPVSARKVMPGEGPAPEKASRPRGKLSRGSSKSGGGSSANLLGKGSTSGNLLPPVGLQRGSTALFASFQNAARTRPSFIKRLSDVHMFGMLTLDAQSLLDPTALEDVKDIKEFTSRKVIKNDKVTYLERVLTNEDLAAMMHDVENETSLFSCDGKGGVDRYQLNMSIRILNDSRDSIMEAVSMLRKTEDKKYELFGFELSDRNRISHNMLEILGLNKDNSFYDIGLFNTPTAKMLPTHRRWPVFEDVMLVGSEIHVMLKLSEWRTDIIAKKCREAVAKLFGCYGVTEKCVKIMSHKSIEQKGSSEFPQCRFKTDCIGNTYLVMHQFDVMVEGVAFSEQRQLIKASMDIAKPGAKPESIGCIWRWRPRNGMDRGTSKVDHSNKSTFDIWGNKFFVLRSLLANIWITCDQAKRLVFEFPQFGPDSQPYRETALLVIFSRIIDLENFHNLIEDTIPLDSHANTFNRIGWLNVLNGFSMDRFFEMDLSLSDNRIVAASLAKLAAVEPGQNCIDPHFRRSVNDHYSRGWDIPANWIVESPNGLFESVPHKGRFNVTYTSSPQKGCRVVPAIRTAVQDRYLLLGVPRGDGTDIYLKDRNDFLEWDDIY
jgi:hypothetical protein